MPVISRANIRDRPSRRRPTFKPISGTQVAKLCTVAPSITAGACISKRPKLASVTAAASQAVRRLKWAEGSAPDQPVSSVPANKGRRMMVSNTVRALRKKWGILGERAQRLSTALVGCGASVVSALAHHEFVGVGNGHGRQQEGDVNDRLGNQHLVGVIGRVDEGLEKMNGADADDRRG